MPLASNDGVVMGIVLGVAFVKAWFKGEYKKGGLGMRLLVPSPPFVFAVVFWAWLMPKRPVQILFCDCLRRYTIRVAN